MTEEKLQQLLNRARSQERERICKLLYVISMDWRDSGKYDRFYVARYWLTEIEDTAEK